MYTHIEDFLSIWENERQSTGKLFSALTDASLAQRVSPDGRTLGRIAWHVVCSIPEMASAAGLDVQGPSEKDGVPESAETIATAFDTAASALRDGLRATWTDAQLLEERAMYGETWKNGFTLAVLLQHQTHHRGQMTVLMRQAGLAIPGVCGPSREEWAAFGMPAME